MSGGEAQRIAIARVIMQKPEYLIMDEATSGIDIVNEAEIIEALENLMQGRTVIMVAHDMQLIRRADNIVVLNGGIVETCGDFDTVLRESTLLQKYQNERSINL